MINKLFLWGILLLTAACATVAPKAINDDLTPDYSRSKPEVQRFMRMGEQAADDNNAELAAMMYRAAQGADATDPAPRLAAARLFESAGEYQAAARLYDDMAKTDNGTNQLTLQLAAARSYLKAKQYGEAAMRYERLANQSGDWRAFNGLGVVRDLEGNQGVAIRAYKTALERAPDAEKSKVRANLALSYVLEGDARGAIDLLEPVEKKEHLSSSEQRYLALAYGFAGRVNDAARLGLKEPPSYELLKQSLETVDGPQAKAAPAGKVTAVPVE